MSTRRRTRLGPKVITAALGALLLLFALVRPSVGRFLAAGLVLGAAAVVRYHDLHRHDPDRYGRAAQLRSLYWSVAIVVVFVSASFLVNALLSN